MNKILAWVYIKGGGVSWLSLAIWAYFGHCGEVGRFLGCGLRFGFGVVGGLGRFLPICAEFRLRWAWGLGLVVGLHSFQPSAVPPFLGGSFLRWWFCRKTCQKVGERAFVASWGFVVNFARSGASWGVAFCRLS